MTAIKILVLFPPAWTDAPQYAEKFIAQKEKEINKKGGIGGLNVAVSMAEIPDSLYDEKLKFSPESDIIISNYTTRFFYHHPDFMDYFPGLFFGTLDPVVPINSERVFDLSDKLLNNRLSLAFFAKAVNSKSIILLQHAELINNDAKRRYR